MPITAIDPTTALVVIDLQQGLADLPTITPVGDVVERANGLAAAFRARGLPVVLVTADGNAPGRTDDGVAGQDYPDGFADLLPQLEDRPTDHRVVKQRWGALHRTGLTERLAELGVTQVVLAGVATSIGVESTARAAYDHGLHVTIASDAVTDVDPATHRNSLERILPRLAEVGTTDEIIGRLSSRLDEHAGKSTSGTR